MNPDANPDDIVKAPQQYEQDVFIDELNGMVANEIASEIKSLAKHNLEISIANCLRQSAFEHFFIIEANHAYHYVANALGQFCLVQSLNREQAAALLKQKS